MSLITLEGIKAAVPTLLPAIGTFLGRVVTVITANPTTVAVAIIGIAYIIWCIYTIKTIMKNDAKLDKLKENIQKTKDIITESEARNIETQEFIEENRVYHECLDADIEIAKRMLERRNQKAAEIDQKFPEFPI